MEFISVFYCATLNGLLGWRGKVGVVGSTSILHAHQNTVVPRTAFPKVVGLEVERALRPAVLVEDVMYGVDQVERVHASSIDI